MLQPNPQQLETIMKVIEKIAPKYVFGYFELDDIRQESYIICCEALEKYDHSRPLENFISKHLSNRLKTLIRDKYSRKDIKNEHHAKLNSVKRALIDLKGFFADDNDFRLKDEEQRDIKEAIQLCMKKLSPSMRNDLSRLLNDVPIQSTRKINLFKKIKEILGEDW